MNLYVEYFVLGLIANFLTILCFFLIPWPTSIEVISTTGFAYIGLFPFVTMILALALNNQKQRILGTHVITNQKALLQASLDSTQTMEIYVINHDYTYIAFNQFHQDSMKKYYGVQIEKGMCLFDVVGEGKIKDRLKKMFDQALDGAVFSKQLQLEIEQEKYLQESYTPIRNSSNEILGITVFSHDITEQVKHEKSMRYLSYHDTLTGVHNRRFYQEQIKHFDQEAFWPLSVMIADINGLKIMNDAFGHEAGDQLLKYVSDVLISIFPDPTNVMRIGGDEFVILLTNTTREQANKFIETFKKVIVKKSILKMKVSVSFGIAVKSDARSMHEVLKEAEDNMYAQKLFEVTSHRNETIKTILQTLQEKNPREELHSKRVSVICSKLGLALNLSSEDINLLNVISSLHDIGKIAIDDAILNKPGKLTEQEWETIKKHPEIGFRILSAAPQYAEIAQDILSHHERHDGKGYPRGLVGEDIPLRARIISIIDSFDAMTSDRPYRKGMTHKEAIDELLRCSGTQFDPKLVDVFVNDVLLTEK